MEFRQSGRCTCFTKATAKAIKMSSVMSLYLPYVFATIGDEKIRGVIEEGYGLGKIDRLDRVPKVDKNGVKYSAVYVHFQFWYDTDTARNFQEKLETGSSARIVYDDPWYWNAFINKSTKREVTTPPTKDPLQSPPPLMTKRALTKEFFDEVEGSFALVDTKYVEMLEAELEALREALCIAYMRNPA